MLTILTGTPGNGKTAHALDLLYFDKSSMWFGLEKFVDGIADLKLEHYEFPDLKELKRPDFVPRSQVDSDEYAVWLPENPLYSAFLEARATAKTPFDLWFLWASPSSVIVVDEAQRYLRPRPSGSAVPLCIQMFEYHRHFGVHVFLITQKERLLHSNVRMLAGQHIHLTDGWRGRHRFEWPECKDSESKSEKALSAHSSYKLPRHVFPHYKSTVQVLGTSHKKPFYIYAMYGAVLVIVAAGYFAFKGFTRGQASVKPADSALVSSGSVVAASGVPDVQSVDDMALQSEEYLKQFRPVVAGRPESAAAFSHLRQVVAMPSIHACIQSATDCRCYTQQGSRVHDMTIGACIDHLAHGSQFNPYAAPVNQARPSIDAFSPSVVAPAVAPS